MEFAYLFLHMCLSVWVCVEFEASLVSILRPASKNNPFSEFFSRIILIMYLTPHFNETIVLYFLLDLSFKGSVLHIYFELNLSE